MPLSFSTREAAKKLGITGAALSHYIKVKKIPAPTIVRTGKASLHLWTEADIDHARKLLPKIANGRKTRYQKQKGKTQKPQPRAAVPHKQRKKQK